MSGNNARERVEVEPERVRSGRLGGVPPYSAHPSEAVAGLDALHVGEDHGRDIQVRIEGGTVRIERMFAVPELNGEAVRGRVLVCRGFFSDGVLFSVLSHQNTKVTDTLVRAGSGRDGRDRAPRRDHPPSGSGQGRGWRKRTRPREFTTTDNFTASQKNRRQISSGVSSMQQRLQPASINRNRVMPKIKPNAEWKPYR